MTEHPRTRSRPAWALAAILAIATACGGGSSTPSSPDPAPPVGGGGGGGATGGTTITIDASGTATPRTLTVPAGTRVTFVNNHTRRHDMASDPHPIHTDCPELNQAGDLAPGQSKQTGNLNTPRRCGYHDHNEPSNAALTGVIVVQ